jgi:signal transduction histidine kinase
MCRIGLRQLLELRRDSLGPNDGVGRQQLELRQELPRLSQGENRAGHAGDYNWSLLRLFSSLTNRIFVASALLAVVSIALGIYNVNVAVTKQAEDELMRGLTEARMLIEENRLFQVVNFTRDARLIADLPRLKAAIGEADSATARGVVEEYQKELAADLFMVTDRQGKVLVWLPEAPDRTVTAPVERLSGVIRAVGGQETSSFVAHTGGILQMVSVPIWIMPSADAPTEILGTLNIGYSLNWHAADKFRSLTNSDVAFGAGGQILASTLPPDAWASLAPLLTHDGVSKQVLLNGGNYIATTVQLSPAVETDTPQPASLNPSAAGAKAIILRSRSERLAFLLPLHTSMLVLAGFAILAATVLSYGIARTVTRPLAVITATMREMSATGDLTRRIPIPAKRHWEDEDARLLASTFNTMTDSIARFQREAAQRERLSALGRLSTVVAHEIRNPLMIIKASLRGLRKDDVAPTDVKTAVADIDEEIARLNRIVTEVLDFAQPIRFDLAPTNINALCADADRASGADGTPLGARMKLDPRLPEVVTDGERVRLVLVNLLTNARHALAGRPSNHGDIAITTTRLTDARIAIDVSDRGTGISPEHLARIFDPYFTTRRTGTGLGLAISRNIIEGLRGTIAISSRTGEGTTVRVELPTS